jgi:O-Antigen ligase
VGYFPLAIPALIGAIQLAAGSTVNRWATRNALLGWGACWAAAFVGLQTGSPERVRAGLRRGLLYFGFGVATLSVLQFFTSPEKIFWLFEGEYAEPVLGPFLSRDRYAAFVELVLPLALYEAFAGKAVAVSYTAMAATMVASVIAGASRAGSVLVLAESAVVLLLLSRDRVFRRPRAGRIAAWFAMFALLFTAVVGWTRLWERFQDPEPYRYRREMLMSAVAMIRERPWTGFGLGSFETVYPAYATFDTGAVVNHAHNDWAEWAAEGRPADGGGVIGSRWLGGAGGHRPAVGAGPGRGGDPQCRGLPDAGTGTGLVGVYANGSDARRCAGGKAARCDVRLRRFSGTDPHSGPERIAEPVRPVRRRPAPGSSGPESDLINTTAFFASNRRTAPNATEGNVRDIIEMRIGPVSMFIMNRAELDSAWLPQLPHRAYRRQDHRKTGHHHRYCGCRHGSTLGTYSLCRAVSRRSTRHICHPVLG